MSPVWNQNTSKIGLNASAKNVELIDFDTTLSVNTVIEAINLTITPLSSGSLRVCVDRHEFEEGKEEWFLAARNVKDFKEVGPMVSYIADYLRQNPLNTLLVTSQKK